MNIKTCCSWFIAWITFLFTTCPFYFTVRVTHRLNRRSRMSTGRSLLPPPVCRPALAPGWRVTALLWRPVTAAGDGGAVFTCKLRQRGSQGAAIRHSYPETGRGKANQQVPVPRERMVAGEALRFTYAIIIRGHSL